MDLALILNNLVKKSHKLRTLVTNNFTAGIYDAIIIDSSLTTFTITLPNNPIIGCRIIIFDAGGKVSINKVTLNGNGYLINNAPTYDIKQNNMIYEIIYYPAKGWIVVVSGGDSSSVGSLNYYEPLVEHTPELIFNSEGDIVVELRRL